MQKISDISIASSLISVGAKFSGIERNPNGRADFTFEDDENFIKESIDLYYRNELKVSALAFANNFRNLKNLIHQK
jgi:hypothetical protein